jgi:hypothetical protein
LTFPTIVAALAVLVAAAALLRARRAARHAEQVSESYWELRYEAGQLRVRINRLEAAAGLGEAAPEDGAEVGTAAPRPAQTTSFVPLSSLKK